MKHVASFVNEQFSGLGSPGKLENRTTSRLLFATIALAVLLLFAAGVVRAQTTSGDCSPDPIIGLMSQGIQRFGPDKPRGWQIGGLC
jgi:hypothetical protein